MIILGIIGFIVLAIGLFVFWFSHSSPVNEAGREYESNVQSYRNSETHSIEDVNERMALLDDHYNSVTFDKMQGGDRTEVSLEDVETLFGAPDEIFDNVAMDSANVVYQYHYDNHTLNFHEYISVIAEYIFETYSEVHYEPEALDALFFNVIYDHQTQTDLEDDTFEMIDKEDSDSLFNTETPTRIIRKGNWSVDSPHYQYYFDWGGADYAPEEYLLLDFKEENDQQTILNFMERRFSHAYLEDNSDAEIDQKTTAWYEFKDIYERIRNDDLEELLTVADIAEEFGDIARLSYGFSDGILRVYWISLSDDDMPKEYVAEVPTSEANLPVTMEEIMTLQVTDFRRDILFPWDRTVMTADFIGSQ